MNRDFARQYSVVLKIEELVDEGAKLHLLELDIKLRADENKQKLFSTLKQLDIFQEIDRNDKAAQTYKNENGDVLPF